MSTRSVLTEKHAISKSDLASLLRQMMLIREIEQKSLELSTSTPPVILGSVHLCAGQEAVPVGTVAGLQDTDQIVSTYRGHGWALASGLSPLEVFGEICHRKIGVNGGRGGSAYMMAPDRRFMGENSIVGAGVPVACGVAMANVSAGNGRVVVVSVGDGAFNQGSLHEGIAFAAARSLPVIIICENNGWSELTPTSVTFKISRIAQRASGYGIPGVTIDGSNPLDVRDTIRQAAKRAREGAGPALIECRVPRLWGHYNRDIEHYRPKEDRDEARTRDPIERLSGTLVGDGLMTQREIDELSTQVKAEVQELAQKVLDSPLPDPATASKHVYAPIGRPPASRASKAGGEEKTLSFIQAVNEALNRELETRPEVLVYGEDVGNSGGVFGATRGLQKKYGEQRVFDTPISESAILGSAVGAALCGMKPIVEIMWADFMLVALDQIINQAANVRYITQGRSGAPIVVRTQQGVTPGSCAQHSQSLEALLAHIPGIRVAVSATPQDAYDLLRSAAAAADPCIVFEARGLYQTTGPVQTENDVEPIGKARLHQPGQRCTDRHLGNHAEACAGCGGKAQKEKRGVGVLDLRWLNPLDEETLLSAVKNACRTGRRGA